MTEEEKQLFINAVLDLIELIPPGRVMSYKKLAKAAGYPHYSRMVGTIISKGELYRNGLPAHRVISSSGELSGKKAFGPAGEMSELLESEGIMVKNGKVLNLDIVMWDPIEEL